MHNLDVVLIEPGPIRTPIWEKTPDIDKNPFLGTEFEIPLRKFTKGYLAIGRKGFSPKIVAKSRAVIDGYFLTGCAITIISVSTI